MRFLVFICLLLSTQSFAGLDTTGLFDYQGNPFTTNVSTGTRNAGDVEVVVSGSIIDPRIIRALTSSDAISCVQSTAGLASQAWFIKWTDGTNTAAVKAASTAPLATDPAGVVTLSPNGNQATAATQSSQLTQETTTATNTTSIQSTSNSTAVNTASIISNQTNGGQKTQLTDPAGSLFQVTKIDAGNSTSTNLGANAVFTGAWTDVSNLSTLSVVVFTNQVSATNGLIVQYSTDGTNVDDDDQYTIPASNGQQFSFPLAARYYRIVYTNGAVAQTVFRLQSKVHSTPIKSSSYRIAMGVPNGEQDAEVVLNVNGRLPLVANAPATVTIGTTSATVLAANSIRKGLSIQNLSNFRVSLALGATAVSGSGIVLYPGGVWNMKEFDFNQGQINGISTAASTILSIQEYQ